MITNDASKRLEDEDPIVLQLLNLAAGAMLAHPSAVPAGLLGLLDEYAAELCHVLTPYRPDRPGTSAAPEKRARLKAAGGWLRAQREKRGWSRPEMARRLINAGRERGEKHLPDVDSVAHNIYRWEAGGGVSHLYAILYCDAFGIPYTGFPRQDRSRTRRKAATPAPPAHSAGC